MPCGAARYGEVTAFSHRFAGKGEDACIRLTVCGFAGSRRAPTTADVVGVSTCTCSPGLLSTLPCWSFMSVQLRACTRRARLYKYACILEDFLVAFLVILPQAHEQEGRKRAVPVGSLSVSSSSSSCVLQNTHSDFQIHTVVLRPRLWIFSAKRGSSCAFPVPMGRTRLFVPRVHHRTARLWLSVVLPLSICISPPFFFYSTCPCGFPAVMAATSVRY